MWPFNKKTTIAASGILVDATDHHSHILPGVDDGVETMAEALRILDSYEALGIKELWLTPHIMEDMPNTPDKLAERFVELQAAYKGNITLHLAAEYMIDNHLRKQLQETNKLRPASERVVQPEAFQETPPRFRGEVVEDRRGEEKTKECPQESIDRGNPCEVTEGSNKKLLPIGKKHDHLLVETSYFTPPMRLHETLQKIKSSGYHPLLAHPERYMYMEKKDYLELNEEGVKFQLNILSLAGGYGNTVKKKAEWLLSNGLYSVAGSDLHCEDAIGYITLCKLGKKEMNNMGKLLAGNI